MKYLFRVNLAETLKLVKAVTTHESPKVAKKHSHGTLLIRRRLGSASSLQASRSVNSVRLEPFHGIIHPRNNSCLKGARGSRRLILSHES